MNNVTIVGRLTKDIELKQTTSGKSVCEFSLAVSRNIKNADGEYDTDFINCQVWNKRAETMAKYCNKGDLIGVEGNLRTDTYEKDDVRHYKTYIYVQRVSFLGKKKQEQQFEFDPTEIEVEDDDMPF